MTNHKITKPTEGGYTALLAVMFLLLISLTIGNSFTSISARGAESGRTSIKSLQSYVAAESGAEDGFYRLKRGKNLPASYSFAVGSSTASVSVASPSSSEKSISASGDNQNFSRQVAIGATSGVGADFNYGVQVGDGGITMNNHSMIIGNVYSNGSIDGSGGTITGNATVAGGISDTPSLSYSSDNSDYFFATTTIRRDVAQSFTANSSAKLNKVSVYLGKVGTPTADITLRITTDSSGKPNTNDMVSTTIPRGSVGVSPSWINVSFTSPPTLASSTKYWIVLDYGTNNASNYWNWRRDSTDGYASQTGKYSDNYSNGTWTNTGGDFSFQVWIGGVATKIANTTVGNGSSGTATANVFENATVHGSLCPNQYCVIDNPPRKELPISDGVIQDFKDDAALGGTCGSPTCSSGTINLSNFDTLTIGPKKIMGNVNLSNHSVLTVSGTLWIVGTLDVSNDSQIRLSPSYGANSGAIIVDGNVNVSNDVVFAGSGQASSYIMVAAVKNAPTSNVIDVSNGSSAVIYYVPHGKIQVSNHGAAKEITAYGISMNNDATVTYESGLADVNFSLGPSGAWNASSWREQ